MKKTFVSIMSAAALAVAVFSVRLAMAAEDTPKAPTKESATVSAKYLEAAQAKLSATFASLKFEDIRPSEIPGVVEIYAGPRIIYYAPEQDILILGELYASNGTSITEQKIARYAAVRAKDLDKKQALVVGDGDAELIAFVDPDCRYCRQAYQWMADPKFPKVKQYIYFMPTEGRPLAHQRAAQALCAPPERRAEALRNVFEGSPSAPDASLPAECKDVEARLAMHAEYAAKVGVYATPFFIVQGQVVAGLDRERLLSLLTHKPATGG